MGKVVHISRGPVWRRSRIERIFYSIQLPYAVGDFRTGFIFAMLVVLAFALAALTMLYVNHHLGLVLGIIEAIALLWFAWVNSQE